MILQFNFFDYFKNPVVKFSHEFNKQKLNKPITVLTLDDCRDDINKLKHSRKALSKGRLSYIGDELRLYYSLQYENLLYIDGDALLKNPGEINKYRNCISYLIDGSGNYHLTTGTFLKSHKNCKFIKYYYDIYEHEDIGGLSDSGVYNRYPTNRSEHDGVAYYEDMALINPSYRHFYTSAYHDIKKRFPDITTVKYTFDPDFYPVGIKGLVVNFCSNRPEKYQIRANGVLQYFNVDDPELGTKEELINLYKEQMNYTYGRELKYEEIGHEYK